MTYNSQLMALDNFECGVLVDGFEEAQSRILLASPPQKLYFGFVWRASASSNLLGPNWKQSGACP